MLKLRELKALSIIIFGNIYCFIIILCQLVSKPRVTIKPDNKLFIKYLTKK